MIRSIYEVRNTGELLAAGFTPEDFANETVELWVENEAPLSLFTSLATQWRMGFSGPIGLDYNVLFHRMDRLALDADEYEILFQDIRIAEAEALDAMATNKG